MTINTFRRPLINVILQFFIIHWTDIKCLLGISCISLSLVTIVDLKYIKEILTSCDILWTLKKCVGCGEDVGNRFHKICLFYLEVTSPSIGAPIRARILENISIQSLCLITTTNKNIYHFTFSLWCVYFLTQYAYRYFVIFIWLW